MGLSSLDWECSCCDGQFNPAISDFDGHRQEGGRCFYCQSHPERCHTMTEAKQSELYPVVRALLGAGINCVILPSLEGPKVVTGVRSELRVYLRSLPRKRPDGKFTKDRPDGTLTPGWESPKIGAVITKGKDGYSIEADGLSVTVSTAKLVPKAVLSLPLVGE